MLTPEQVIVWGGDWLAVTRKFIQNNFKNGSTVLWNSDMILEGSITCKDLENLAREIAIKAIEQDRRVKG